MQESLLTNHEKYLRHQYKKCMCLKFQNQCVLKSIRRVRVRLSTIAKVHLSRVSQVRYYSYCAVQRGKIRMLSSYFIKFYDQRSSGRPTKHGKH